MPHKATERPADKTFMLTLDPKLHEALRTRAFNNKSSMRDILRDLLREQLKPELNEQAKP